MSPDRTKLLNILTQLEQAETAANKLLTLDAGPPADALIEIIGTSVEDMRAIVQAMLGD